MLRAVAAIATGLLVAAVGACAPATSPSASASNASTGSAPAAATPNASIGGTAPALEALLGIWLLQPGDTLLRFGRDGTFVINNGEPLTTDPDRTGTFSIDGQTIRFVQDAQEDCPAGSVDVWSVGLLADGLLRVLIEESPCPPGPGAHGDWLRISPHSALERDVTAGPGSPTGAGEGNLIGHVWIVDGTSTLLSLSADGTYAWDDGGLLDTQPADAGTWQLDGQTLSLVSAASSEVCAEGDSLVLRDGRIYLPANATFLRIWRTAASGDPCGRLEGDVVLTLIA